MSHARRAMFRTVVFLDRRLNAIPGSTEWARLLSAGRVKQITFTKNYTEDKIREQLINSFASLAGKDLSRLEFIASYSRGHAMMRVATGVQTGAKIAELFGGGSKKKVFLYLPSDPSTNNNVSVTNPLSTATSNNPTTTCSNATITSQMNVTNGNYAPVATAAGSSTLPLHAARNPSSNSDASITNPAGSNALTTQGNVASAALGGVTNAIISRSVPVLTPAVTTGGSLPSNSNNCINSDITAQATVSGAVTNVTNTISGPIVSPATSTSSSTPLSLPLPTDGHSTRLYLTRLAAIASTIRDSPDRISIDDSADHDLLQSPFADDDITILDSPQVTPRRPRRHFRPSVTSTITRPVITSVSGCHSQPFYGDGIRVGTVTEDFSSHGLGGGTSRHSRTNEVSRCENIVEVLYNNVDNPMPPLLNHSFEEVCWQARECRRPIVAVLLNTSSQSKSRETMLRALQRVIAGCKEDWLYWGAETSSENGEKVLQLYGNGQEDQIIILAPSAGGNMVFIERIEDGNPGLDVTDLNPNRVHERVRIMIEGLSLEREQLGKWQSEREAQEMALRDIQEKDKEKEKEKEKEREEMHKDDQIMGVEDAPTNMVAKQIREARRLRIRPPPDEGIKIILRLKDGEKIWRKFGKNALFQEVYDWAGAMDDVPLHFTIQRRQTVVRHCDPLDTHEILDLSEREENQITSLLQSQVSFRGNFPPDNDDNLSATIVDEHEMEKNKSEEEEEDSREGEKINAWEEEKGEIQREVNDEEREKQPEMEEKEDEKEGGELRGENEERNNRKRRKDRRTTAQRKRAKKNNEAM